MSEVLKSLYFTQDEILMAIQKLHLPEGYECDITYGKGGFWRNIPKPSLCFDIIPVEGQSEYADSRVLPLADSSLSNCVFDPPFMTYIRDGKDHKDGKVVLSKRFGGYYKYDDLINHYAATIRECSRVLRKRGKLIFKCQDIVHNHKLHHTHTGVIIAAEACGFDLLDLFILGAKHRMPSPQRGTQRHARIFHSYFLVFEK